MNKPLTSLILSLCALLAIAAPKKVACIGDSITQGIGTQQAADKSFPHSYPSQLGKLLGDGYEVRNWGVGGRTLIRKADRLDYGRALRTDPDIVVICVGTNDSKPYCWDKFKDDFESDYTRMIKEFQARPSKPRVILCLPPPAFDGGRWGIREEILETKIRPAVKRLAAQNGCTVLDLAAPLRGDGKLFPDRIHPNVAGAGKIAKLVFDTIQKQP